MAAQSTEADADADSGSGSGSRSGPEAGPKHSRSGPDARPASDTRPKPNTRPIPEAATKDAAPEPGSGSGSRLWHSVGLARATAVDLAVLAGHLVLYPTGILPERDHAQDMGRAHPPVLLLHGFIDNRSTFALLRHSLHRHGWTRVQALNYSPLTGDIRTAAEHLGRHIEEICRQSGHRRVDIVGHSLGGLIARYCVQCLGGDARVRTLVTLGTPHTGTRAVPALAPHPIIRQMRPGSAVLAELAGPARGCRTRFVAFWSDLDQLMIPVESARLEHPDLIAESIQVSGVGHLALPVHGTVAAEIRRALAGEGPLRSSIEAA